MFYSRKHLKIYFIGIGGIGTSGIAEILLRLGYKISGSDVEDSEKIAYLRKLGAEIFIGHRAENIGDKTMVVVYSSAISLDNPEVQRSRELNIPLIKRAEMLAELIRLKYGIAIAGTHGKTTTSSILATIMHECGIDITHIIGGVVHNFGGNAKLGKSDFIIVEADESDGSFLSLHPILSVITNIDNDHLNYYEEEKNIFESFLKFSNNIPFYGYNVCNINDENVQKLIQETSRPYLTFGIDVDCDYCAKNLKNDNKSVTYELFFRGKLIGDIHLNMLGRHNVLNSLAAIAVAHQIIPEIDFIIHAISKFHGVKRRFEKLYESDGLMIIDDYAHHPTEMKETFLAAKELGKDKMIVICELHRFSRTRDCWSKFIECLKIPNKVFLLPIYPASESPIPGINARSLSLEIPHAEALGDFMEIEKIIEQYKNSNTLILTLGAGAIGKNIRTLISQL